MACARIRSPGLMAPPTNSPLASTRSYVMHVPASMTSDALPGNKAQAPTAFAIRSTPNVSGVEYPLRMGTGVLPFTSSTGANRCSCSRNFSSTSATDPRTTCRGGRLFNKPIRPCISKPCTPPIRMQWPFTYHPSLVRVFPISTTRSNWYSMVARSVYLCGPVRRNATSTPDKVMVP